MGTITAYVRNSCLFNGHTNSKAGYGIVFEGFPHFNETWRLGTYSYHTNVSAEMEAINMAIKRAIQWGCHGVNVVTSMSFISDAANEGWIYNWMKNGWYRFDDYGEWVPVENTNLWLEFESLRSQIDVGIGFSFAGDHKLSRVAKALANQAVYGNC